VVRERIETSNRNSSALNYATRSTIQLGEKVQGGLTEDAQTGLIIPFDERVEYVSNFLSAATFTTVPAPVTTLSTLLLFFFGPPAQNYYYYYYYYYF